MGQIAGVIGRHDYTGCWTLYYMRVLRLGFWLVAGWLGMETPQMKGKRKKFSMGAYKKFDGPAKEAMRKHLEASGHVVTVPPENFAVDLFSDLHDVRMYHEVEVTNNWMKDKFPFLTGSIPARKIRLVEMYQNVPLFFWRLRGDLKRALVYSSAHMIDDYLVEVPNVEVSDGEYFYRIPIEFGKEFDLLL